MHRKELYELQSVVTAIDDKLRLFVESARTDQVGSMEYLWLSITRLGSALDAVFSRVRGVENNVGDTSDLMDDYNLTDLSEGLTRALNQASTGGSTQLVKFQESIVDLHEKVGDLEQLISAVDDDNQKAGWFLLGAVHSRRGCIDSSLRGVYYNAQSDSCCPSPVNGVRGEQGQQG